MKKRLVAVLLAIALVFMASSVMAKQKQVNNLQIFDGEAISAGVSHFYVIDTRDPTYNYPEDWNWSLQFLTGTTEPSSNGYLSGATVGAYFAVANDAITGTTGTVTIPLLSGQTSSTVPQRMQWNGIVTNLAHDTAAANYVYSFYPDQARYIVIGVLSGATDMLIDVKIDFD